MLIDTNVKEVVDGGSGYMNVDFHNIFFNFLNEHKYNVCTLLRDFIEVTLLHGCSPVNFAATPFPKNASRWLLLNESTTHATMQFRHS